MIQAASTLPYNFNFVDFTSWAKGRTGALTKSSPVITEVNHNDLKENNLIKWLNGSNIAIITYFTLTPAGRLFQNDRLVIKFSLTKTHSENFVLLRGLLNFSRPKGVTITSNRTDKSFKVELSANEVENTISYFKNIFQWFVKEIKFKIALREVIHFENKIRTERKGLYTNLQSALY